MAAFRWEGPKKVGTGWNGLEQVFSDGDGIIYAIEPFVEATVHALGGTTPASGGNLRWYRHLGRDDGSFRWEGPKKVGTGWNGLEQVFSGGDGIIYAVDPFVEAAVHALGGTTPASGGNLRWYRHLGRDDGSFRWEGPKKVGTGWAGLQQVFSGGDGIIYAIEPFVEAAVHALGGTTPASGGNLRWYRHTGREDGTFRWEGPKKVGTGWGGLKMAFSGGSENLANVRQQRFCGVSDPASDGLHVTTFGAPGGRWSHGNLSFNVDPSGSGLGKAEVEGVLDAAFGNWAVAAPYFSFKRVTGDADITIKFGGSALEASFGGVPGGVLGVGYYPEDGRIFFDSSEVWTSPLLMTVALHEIGHVLGLAHSTNRASIMYPYGPSIGIDAETIEAINGLYGWQPQTPLRDSGSTAGPSMAAAGAVSLQDNYTHLYLAWRGVHGDDGIYWSALNGDGWSPQVQIGGIGSSHGPALASGFTTNRGGSGLVTGLFMAWDGVPGDDALYFAQNPDPAFNNWTSQGQIPGAGTSARPALAMFNGMMHAAWKGISGDSTIYWSRFDGESWTPQKHILGRGTSSGASLAVQGNRLYMFWKGIDGDSDAYFAWLDDQPDAVWQVAQKIAYTEAEAEGNVSVEIGTSDQPVAAVRGDSIVLGWKGVPGDSGLYFSRFRNDEWSGQTNVADVGSSSGPASRRSTAGCTWPGPEFRAIPGCTSPGLARLSSS